MKSSDTVLVMTCKRETQSGAGFSHVCELQEGHTGAHYSNPHKIPTMGLTWTHENWQGHAVFPNTPGAKDVTKKA